MTGNDQISHLKNNKEFTVIAKNANKRNKYIQKAFLNDQEIFSPFLTHKQLTNGGTFELIRGKKPNKDCGTNVILPKWKLNI